MSASVLRDLCHWRLGLAVALVATASLQSAPASEADAARTPRALESHARSLLHEIMLSEESWVKIHAAEALMAAGETEAIRAYFLEELPRTNASVYRIGVYRVLAAAAHSPAERASWIAKVEKVYLDPTAPDQNQAIETLCKLRYRVTGPALDLVRHRRSGPRSAPMALALWSATLAGEPHALEDLAQLLDSQDNDLRRGAAYALRWLRPSAPAVRSILARAAARAVPDYSDSSVYILGAALAADADPARTQDWLAMIKFTLASDAFSPEERFEASWTLRQHSKSADLPALARLLDLPVADNDVRIGAATVILATLAREGGR